LSIKETTTYVNGNPGPGVGQTQNCDGVKLSNGIQTYPPDNWISNDNIDINKQYKTCTDLLS